MPLVIPPSAATAWRMKYAPLKGVDLVQNSASELALAGSYTIPAGSLVAGDAVFCVLYGIYSATVAQTLRAKIKLGSVTLIDTGALTGIANGSNFAWNGSILLTFPSVGASGKCTANAALNFGTAATVALSVNVGSTTDATIDTTAAQALTITCQWSSANALNILELRHMLIL